MTTSCNFIMFLFGTFRLIVHIHSQGEVIFISNIIIIFISHSILGSSISFSPNSPLCIEEEVEMLCFVETSEQFAFSTAFLSINSSSPFTISELNTNSSKCADLSLYSANTDGLNVSRNRAGIRLIIHNYQPSDSHTIFGCHGMFPNISYSTFLYFFKLKIPTFSLLLYKIFSKMLTLLSNLFRFRINSCFHSL